jgi:nitroimidazol reductase NimA-like FMN-containing flavoprotein (pyridoxamine 5'-phosphate oxidase superfamily)
VEILGTDECRRLLATARVGRVAFCQAGVAVVLPVTYAAVGGDIVYFTGAGQKLDAARQGRTVSFEVDEIDTPGERGWSVLAVGPCCLASPATKARAEALGLYPWAAGDRQQLVRIRPLSLTGRRILQ